MRYTMTAFVAMLAVAAEASKSELEGRWDLIQVEHDGKVTPAWKFFYKHIVFDCKEYEPGFPR